MIFDLCDLCMSFQIEKKYTQKKQTITYLFRQRKAANFTFQNLVGWYGSLHFRCHWWFS